MGDEQLSAQASDLLSMAGQAGMLYVQRYMDQRGRICDPRDEEIELLQKGYLAVVRSDSNVVQYCPTPKASEYLSAKRLSRV